MPCPGNPDPSRSCLPRTGSLAPLAAPGTRLAFARRDGKVDSGSGSVAGSRPDTGSEGAGHVNARTNGSTRRSIPRGWDGKVFGRWSSRGGEHRVGDLGASHRARPARGRDLVWLHAADRSGGRAGGAAAARAGGGRRRSAAELERRPGEEGDPRLRRGRDPRGERHVRAPGRAGCRLRSRRHADL